MVAGRAFALCFLVEPYMPQEKWILGLSGLLRTFWGSFFSFPLWGKASPQWKEVGRKYGGDTVESANAELAFLPMLFPPKTNLFAQEGEQI